MLCRSAAASADVPKLQMFRKAAAGAAGAGAAPLGFADQVLKRYTPLSFGDTNSVS
jgi:hypothetical protein